MKKQHALGLAGLAAVGMVAATTLANPFTASERNKWTKLGQSGAKRTFFKSSQCKLRFVDKQNNVWTRWEVDARKLSPNLGCKSGTGACVTEQTRPNGGSFSAPTNKTSIPSNRVQSSSVWGRALRCHPWTMPAPNSLSWSYRAGDPTAGAAKTISITGNRRHATDGRVGGIGICRVTDRGATFIGTLYNRQASGQKVFVDQGRKFIEKTVAGNHTVSVCVINHDDHKLTHSPLEWIGEHYFNFEYLVGSISESRWTRSPKTSLAAPAATLDGELAYICMDGWNYTQVNQTTGATMKLGLRSFGFRKAGENHCYTARVPSGNVHSSWGGAQRRKWLLRK